MANISLKNIYNYLFYDINIVFNMNMNEFINNFLMTVFFLVVETEIKKEIVQRSLCEIKKAAFPIVADIITSLVASLSI